MRKNKFHSRAEKLSQRQNKAAEIKHLHGKDLQDKRAKVLKEIEEKRRASKKAEGQDEEWEDVDEHEKEVFATTGYFDVPDTDAHISMADQKLLKKMDDGPADGKNLADLIMAKMSAGDFIDGDKMDNKSSMPDSALDPKVIAAYKKVAVVMRSFKSGKLPKAFKIIPQTQNWEELLILTDPGKWSAHSTFEATKIFSSQLNQKMA